MRLRRPDGATALKRRLLAGLPSGLPGPPPGLADQAQPGPGRAGPGVVSVPLFEWDAVAALGPAAATEWLLRRVRPAAAGPAGAGPGSPPGGPGGAG